MPTHFLAYETTGDLALAKFVKIELEYHQPKGGPSYTSVEHSLGVTVSESFVTLVGKPLPTYHISRVICTGSAASNVSGNL